MGRKNKSKSKNPNVCNLNIPVDKKSSENNLSSENVQSQINFEKPSVSQCDEEKRVPDIIDTKKSNDEVIDISAIALAPDPSPPKRQKSGRKFKCEKKNLISETDTIESNINNLNDTANQIISESPLIIEQTTKKIEKEDKKLSDIKIEVNYQKQEKISMKKTNKKKNKNKAEAPIDIIDIASSKLNIEGLKVTQNKCLLENNSNAKVINSDITEISNSNKNTIFINDNIPKINNTSNIELNNASHDSTEIIENILSVLKKDCCSAITKEFSEDIACPRATEEGTAIKDEIEKQINSSSTSVIHPKDIICFASSSNEKKIKDFNLDLNEINASLKNNNLVNQPSFQKQLFEESSYANMKNKKKQKNNNINPQSSISTSNKNLKTQCNQIDSQSEPINVVDNSDNLLPKIIKPTKSTGLTCLIELKKSMENILHEFEIIEAKKNINVIGENTNKPKKESDFETLPADGSLYLPETCHSENQEETINTGECDILQVTNLPKQTSNQSDDSDQPNFKTDPKHKGKGKGKKKTKENSESQTALNTTKLEPLSDSKINANAKIKHINPESFDKSTLKIKSDGENFETTIDHLGKKPEAITEKKEILKSIDPDSPILATDNQNVDQSKNLQGPTDIPVVSNKIDYKKEKNKFCTPENRNLNPENNLPILEKNIVPPRTKKNKKTLNKALQNVESEDEDEFVYRYSFRKVFMCNTCQICKKELKNRRVTCDYCNMIAYCDQKHKDQDWVEHQALCFAISTYIHLKGLKYIYSDASLTSGHEYRLLRMQTIVSCEKILKRKLNPWEQECLLYPRICMKESCREWRTAFLKDCEDCCQVSFCVEDPSHLSQDHREWCRSYKLYYQLVAHQQNKGRIEPKLPSFIAQDANFSLPEKIDELLNIMYFGNIDLDDCHYAALTQLATAPLTALYGYEKYYIKANTLSTKRSGFGDGIFTIHVVGAELQFEADTLKKWEVFFLHLSPQLNQLNITFVGPELNPSKLPLDLLKKIKSCKTCRQSGKKVSFEFHDGVLYHNFVSSEAYSIPDLVCAFNPGLHRTTGFGSLDTWPDTIRAVLNIKAPFCVTSYTKFELPRDLERIKACAEENFKLQVFLEPAWNPYASIRPDRNFISDDEMPLIFKNYYMMIVSGL